MALRSVEDLMEEIKRRYNKNPLGWHVLTGKDRRGFNTIFILHGDELWEIKAERINPYEVIGYGLELGSVGEEAKKLIKTPYSYGLRPVPKDLSLQLLNRRLSRELFRRLMTISPASIDELKGPMIVEGPIATSMKPLEIISEKQKELDAKLAMELRKLLYRKLPFYQ